MRANQRSYTNQKKKMEREQRANATLYPEFYAMVQKQSRKKRKCPWCGVMRMSQNPGDRYCGQCEIKAKRAPARAGFTIDMPQSCRNYEQILMKRI